TEHEELPERQGGEPSAHHGSSGRASGGGTIAAEGPGLVTTVHEHELGLGVCLLERTHVISPVEWTIWTDRQSAPAARRGIETPGIDLTIPTRARGWARRPLGAERVRPAATTQTRGERLPSASAKPLGKQGIDQPAAVLLADEMTVV